MSKREKIALGLVRKPEKDGEQRQYDIGAAFWYELASMAAYVTDARGHLALYTSKDGNALAISVKAGKDRKVYWIGPDDDWRDTIENIIVDWGMGLEDDVLYPEVKRLAAQLNAEGGSSG